MFGQLFFAFSFPILQQSTAWRRRIGLHWPGNPIVRLSGLLRVGSIGYHRLDIIHLHRRWRRRGACLWRHRAMLLQTVTLPPLLASLITSACRRKAQATDYAEMGNLPAEARASLVNSE
jgi:hypothetical protein